MDFCDVIHRHLSLQYVQLKAGNAAVSNLGLCLGERWGMTKSANSLPDAQSRSIHNPCPPYDFGDSMFPKAAACHMAEHSHILSCSRLLFWVEYWTYKFTHLSLAVLPISPSCSDSTQAKSDVMKWKFGIQKEVIQNNDADLELLVIGSERFTPISNP